MTPDEVNKFLATEVMGWTFNHGVRISKRLPPSPYYEGDGRIMAAAAWNPHHSIADAMRVVEKIGGGWSIERWEDECWSVEIDSDSTYGSHHTLIRLPAAISLAAVEWAKAKKG